MTKSLASKGTSPRKSDPAKSWKTIAVLFVVGAVSGYGVASFARDAIDRLPEGAAAGSVLAALAVALVYLLMGVMTGLGALAPRAGAHFLNVEDADELREERAALIPSALGCVLLAGGLAALALGGAGGALEAGAALAIFLAASILGAWLSVRTLRASDELMRQLMSDSAALGFYALFTVLGGWAALAHLGFVPAPAMLDVVTLFYALTLVACFWVIGRRGMLNR